jgi:hypothetical protein
MSATTFNFAEVQSSKEVKAVIRPGVSENITIAGVSEGQTPNGKKIISVVFNNPEGAELTIDMSMEGGAPQYTMRKLKHLMTKVASEDIVNSATNVDAVNKILAGATLRMKFTGEEYVSQRDGKVYVKTVLGLPNFAEAMTTSKEMSALSYDPKSDYDLKKVNQATVEGNAPQLAKTDDLPF